MKWQKLKSNEAINNSYLEGSDVETSLLKKYIHVNPNYQGLLTNKKLQRLKKKEPWKFKLNDPLMTLLLSFWL